MVPIAAKIKAPPVDMGEIPAKDPPAPTAAIKASGSTPPTCAAISVHMGIIVGYTTANAELTRLSKPADTPIRGIAVLLVIMEEIAALSNFIPPTLSTMVSKTPTPNTIIIVPQGRAFKHSPSGAMPNKTKSALDIKAAKPMLTLNTIINTNISNMPLKAISCLAAKGPGFVTVALVVVNLYPLK